MYLVYHKCLTKYLHGFTLMEVNRRKEEQNGNGEGGASLPLKSQQISEEGGTGHGEGTAGTRFTRSPNPSS